MRDFFRPNQWPNTPDILTEFLQIGGRAVFAIRLLLAATLGSNYGIYGPAFELMEPRRSPRQRRISRLRKVRNLQLESGPPRQPAPAIISPVNASATKMRRSSTTGIYNSTRR